MEIPTASGLAFSSREAPEKACGRTLTFAERVAYQRAIEEVYWRHRIWPKERPDPKPSLDAVMSQAEIAKRVANYLRNSQALEDYWQRPITAEQLQAEMDRMAKHTKQPEVLRDLFEALGNDPFVIVECVARPALAERLLTNWYAYDPRIHNELKHRAEAELQAHSTGEQMKQLSGKYSEIELIKSDDGENENNDGAERGVKLASREWDKTVQELTALFAGDSNASARAGVLNRAAAAGVLPAKAASIMEIKTGVVSRLQEDETSYYATAVIEKSRDRLKLARIIWSKQPVESWLAKAESPPADATMAQTDSYALPNISDAGGGCADDTWTLTPAPPEGREQHTTVWTGSEMIVWGGLAIDVGILNTGGRYNPSTDTWAATNAHAPAARYAHTAVWTGSEMIVWGGYDGLNDLKTGGRYNATMDTWTATTTNNAPSARAYHTAVWTGSEMIVWGGGGLNTGGKYNPSTDTWTDTSTSNAPSAREYHTAVWTGNEMIVWGGFLNLDTGGKYHPDTDTWTATSTTNAPLGRSLHTAVWTGSEMIVWGGYYIDRTFIALNTGGRYNPDTDSWTSTSTVNVPAARWDHSAVWTGSEMIVWGGTDLTANFNTGGKYDPNTGSWTATSIVNAPSARASHTAVWTGAEMILWGGNGNTGGRYSPQTDSWVNTGTNNAPSVRTSHTAVWTGSEMIVWGGYYIDDDFHALNTGGRYDPNTDSWTITSTINAPDARSSHTAVWSGNKMIVWGGTSGTSEFNTGSRYDPASDSWTATGTVNPPVARQHHSAVWTGTEMIVWGGYGCGGNCNLNSGGRYNPDTDSWMPTSTINVPDARWYHTAVWTGSEMIVWGGTDAIPNHEYLRTGGRYNPGNDSWTPTNVINVPLGRIAHTAVWTGSEMIVWGGNDVTFNDTNTGGIYNPIMDSWAATGTTNAPAPRESHTAVWTGSEMIVWGGNGLDTGGKYNPSMDNWTATSTTDAPSGRSSQTAVWTGTEMIVWGGLHGGFGYLNSGGRYCAQSGPTPTPTPTPRPITLSGTGRKVGGINTVRLTWSGATSTNIDVYRDRALIVTTANDGSYTDSTGDTGRARYTYEACEAGTSTCSNNARVTFRQ
jgi:N-acetylneuraminic acid mutarotase